MWSSVSSRVRRPLAILSAICAVSVMASVTVSSQDTVAEKLAHMSLEEKVGQMLMFGFPYTDAKSATQLVRDFHLGGIILFKENVKSRDQLRQLTSGLQKVARTSGGPGLLISTDEEGGKVERLKDVTGQAFQTNKQWGLDYATDKAKASSGVEAQAAATAKAFKDLGVNMNLAPVLDVVTIPNNSIIGAKERSYGGDAAVVSDLGIRYINRLQGDGVIATAKHFPGHGPTPVDSHLDRPVSQVSKKELDEVHLVPFKAAVDAGVAAVMTAHIIYSAYDPQNPATLSPIWLGTVLRERMGFKGVVITDGMLMGAMGKHYTTAESVLASVRAGADILLFDHGTTQQKEAYQALLGAVKSGAISQSRLNASVGRILSMKRQYDIW